MELRSPSPEAIRSASSNWTKRTSEAGSSGGLLEMFDSVFREISAPQPIAAAANVSKTESKSPSRTEESNSSQTDSESTESTANETDVDQPVADEVVEPPFQQLEPTIEVPAEEAQETLPDGLNDVLPTDEEADKSETPEIVAVAVPVDVIEVAENLAGEEQVVDAGEAVLIANGSSGNKSGDKLQTAQASSRATTADLSEPQSLDAAAVEQTQAGETENADEVTTPDSSRFESTAEKDPARRVGARYKVRSDARADERTDVASESIEENSSTESGDGQRTDTSADLVKQRPSAFGEATSTFMEMAPVPSQPVPAVVAPATQAISEAVSALEGLKHRSSASQLTDVDSSPESPASTESTVRKSENGRDGIGETKQTSANSNAMQVRLVQRVSRAFQRLGPDGGRINILLHPAELGSVRLDLRVDGKHMNAKIVAESETAMSVLRDSLPDLKLRLSESGIVVDKLELELSDQGQSRDRDFNFGQQQDERSDRETGHTFERNRPQRERTETSVEARDGRRSIDGRRGPLNLIA